MNNDTDFLGLLIGFSVIAADIFCVLGTGMLIIQRIKPREAWAHPLFYAWCAILVIAIASLAYLLVMYLATGERDATGRVMLYGLFLGFLPILISGVIAALLKP